MMERLSALVLDGDPASLSTISETLAKFNFKVFPFQTAEMALDFIKRGAAKEAELDLVLVEVNLNDMAPGTSAKSDLLHHILNELHVPLTAMCSCDDEEALSKCMNQGACFHVLKPLDRRSFSILWHQALEHKSKKAAPQGPTLNSTKNRMVSSSTEKPKEVLILERNDLSNPESNGYEEPKKRNRVTWTIELHEKFLEAVEALGGDAYATPEGILHLMSIKGLTAKHIGSHLQKYRLHHRNTKQGGQRQENASRKPIPELIISVHDEYTSESITPRLETDGEVYPLRLWAKMKKRSVDTVALKADMYKCTSGNYTEDTESMWDKYENKLQRVFSEKKKRWQFMSEHQWPGKNNIVITDEGDPNEAPETAGGASIEISGSGSLTSDQVGENNRAETDRDNNTMGSIDLLEGYGASIESSGSSSLLASDQVGENNHSEAARANDNVGNITLLEAYRAYIGTSGSGSLLTSDQVRQNGYAEATGDNDNLGSINLPQGYGAFTEISGSSNMLTSNQVGENNRTEFARDNDHMENINLLKVYGASIENAGSSSLFTSDQVGQNNLTEAARNNDTMGNISFLQGIVDPEYIASMDFSVAWAHLESNDLDLTGPSDDREEADSFWMSQLESLGLEDHLQVGDNACNDALRSVDLINVDEPVTQGSQEQQSLGMEGLLQVDDTAWDDALISVGLMNLLDEPMTEEATVGGSQDQLSLAPEVLQAGDNAWGDDLRSAGMVNLLDEPIAQEAAIGDVLMDDPMIPIAQDDVLWAWSPAVPAVDYGMLF